MTDQILSYISDKYQLVPESPWKKDPEYLCFKAAQNDKCFVLLMKVSPEVFCSRLVDVPDGAAFADNEIWIMNVKADPDFIMMSASIKGYMPAYHMNKQHWVSVLLDGSVPWEQVRNAIDRSYDLVTYSPSGRIYEAVKKVPAGRVATYGQIAELAGDRKMARAVGNALHRNPDPDEIPCFRIVNSKGELSGEFAFGGAGAQAALLMADGIEVVEGRVDLSKYGIEIINGEVK